MLHHMRTILVCYGGHFESKMAAKIQKLSDLGKIWFPSRFCSCKLIIVIVFRIGSHIMIFQIISYLVIKSRSEVWRLIVFAPFLIIIIIIIIIIPLLLPRRNLSDHILRD